MMQAHVLQRLTARAESDIAELKEHMASCGAANRTLTLRWWELGTLAPDLGWRSKDHMESVRCSHEHLSGLGVAACSHNRLRVCCSDWYDLAVP